jgi:hypothetical protein
MDPFVEMQEWDDFHPNFITEVQTQLAPRVEPKYFVRIEKRIYFDRPVDEDEGVYKREQRVPDVAVLQANEATAFSTSSAGTATMTAAEECVVPVADERREYFLLIRGRASHEIITVLELLSPTNKRPGASGSEIYLEKRQEILDGLSHFVELDLVRGGKRLPLHTSKPLGQDYYALVSRRNRRPRAELYRWTLRQPMPEIFIPLAKGDPDVPLDLQAAFTNVYRRTRYDLSIDYDAPLAPPPVDDQQEWLRELLGQAGRHTAS